MKSRAQSTEIRRRRCTRQPQPAGEHQLKQTTANMATTMLYLVRHAHADWQPDETRPLSESGRAAAQAIAGLLSAVTGCGASIRALHRDQSRRRKPLAQRLGIRVDVVPEPRERQLPAVPAGDFERIVQECWRVPTRATADGESNALAQTRGLMLSRQFIARHAEQRLVVATHGNLMALFSTDSTRRLGMSSGANSHSQMSTNWSSRPVL